MQPSSRPARIYHNVPAAIQLIPRVGITVRAAPVPSMPDRASRSCLPTRSIRPGRMPPPAPTGTGGQCRRRRIRSTECSRTSLRISQQSRSGAVGNTTKRTARRSGGWRSRARYPASQSRSRESSQPDTHEPCTATSPLFEGSRRDAPGPTNVCVARCQRAVPSSAGNEPVAGRRIRPAPNAPCSWPSIALRRWLLQRPR